MSDPAAERGEIGRGRSFGPLAEALRKRGALEEALRVVEEGLAREPDHLPGYLVLSRIRMNQQDWQGAEVALRAALALDPSHPGVLEGMADVAEASGRRAEGRAWRDALTDAHGTGAPEIAAAAPLPSVSPGAPEETDPTDFILTESLAGLYRRQGHLEKAVEVYDALSRLSPDNEALAARREALRQELLGNRPRPYDSSLSGGTSVQAWLAGIAAAAPVSAPPGETGYDAFFEAPASPPHHPTDFEAFQAWLKGLGQ